jgi:transcriptional regulator with XRE-family HTH domain
VLTATIFSFVCAPSVVSSCLCDEERRRYPHSPYDLNSSSSFTPSQVGPRYSQMCPERGRTLFYAARKLAVQEPQDSMVHSEQSIVAERLTLLFERYRQPNGKKWTYRQVAEWINERFGQDKEIISASYVFQLKSGARPNPSQKMLEMVAAFFNVDPGVLIAQNLEEGALPDADEVVIRQALSDSGLRHAMFLLAGVRRDKLPAVLAVLELASETLSEQRAEQVRSTNERNARRKTRHARDRENEEERENGATTEQHT